MPEFSAAHVDSIIAIFRANHDAIADSLNLCFGLQGKLALRDPQPWAADAIPDEPGVLVAYHLSGSGLLCLLPKSAPLPGWVDSPSPADEARLQTLALEWSLNMLPPEFEAAAFATLPVPSIAQAAAEAEPHESAMIIPVGSGDDALAPPRLFLILPVANAPVPKQEATLPQLTAAPRPSAPVSEPPPLFREYVPASHGHATDAPSPKLQRLLGLPVSVSVRLAEKRVELGTLMSLTPGSLITFSKPCEDLLDLYVNNQRYCRGEAVKIGEKFGLKINEVGVVEHRTSPVL